MASGIQDIVIGVGHLRQQVAFYSANLGLRVLAKGRLPPELCHDLWQVDQSLDTVLMGRVDLPNSVRLRLVRTSGLAARPDFDVTPPGPLGLVFGTVEAKRAYYRLSGDGVEFHAAPIILEPPEEDLEARHRIAYGRAYDGEYLILREPVVAGTASPYFGVTEPLACQIVTRDLAAASSFFEHVLEQKTAHAEKRSGMFWERAMGLSAGRTSTIQVLEGTPGLGAQTVLISYSPSVGPDTEVRPPARGICALRYECHALEARLELAQTLGARVISPPRSVRDPVLGEGWAATLMPPLGVLIELWQPH